jgi:hypothetical protein
LGKSILVVLCAGSMLLLALKLRARQGVINKLSGAVAKVS